MFNFQFIDYMEDKKLQDMKGAWSSNHRQRALRLNLGSACC